MARFKIKFSTNTIKESRGPDACRVFSLNAKNVKAAETTFKRFCFMDWGRRLNEIGLEILSIKEVETK